MFSRSSIFSKIKLWVAWWLIWMLPLRSIDLIFLAEEFNDKKLLTNEVAILLLIVYIPIFVLGPFIVWKCSMNCSSRGWTSVARALLFIIPILSYFHYLGSHIGHTDQISAIVDVSLMLSVASILIYIISKLFKNDRIFTICDTYIYPIMLLLIYSSFIFGITISESRFTSNITQKEQIHSEIIENTMLELEKHKIYSVIFRYHPQSRLKLADNLRVLLAYESLSSKDIEMHFQKIASKFVSNHLNQYILSAPNESVHKLLMRNLIVLKQLKINPKQCVLYFLGMPMVSNDGLPENFINDESNIKASIILAAIKTPTKFQRAESLDSIMEMIILGYIGKRYNIDDLSMLDKLEKLDPSKACDMAIKFSDVLATLPPDKGALILKNLIFLESESNMN